MKSESQSFFGSSRLRMSFIVLFVALVLGYVFTSVTVWTTDSRFLTISRYSRVSIHRDLVLGKGTAPEQYRIGGFMLIEHFFKYFPLKWFDNYNENLSNLLTDEAAWTPEIMKSANYMYTEANKQELIASINNTIDSILEDLFKDSVLAQNLLKNLIGEIRWQDYVSDVKRTALLIGNLLPSDIRSYLDPDSDETRIMNGYFNSRFFFSSLLYILIYFYARCFLSRPLSVFSMFTFAAILPFVTQEFLQAEALYSVCIFTASLLAMLKRRTGIILTLLVILGCTARPDHALFISGIFCLYYGLDALRVRKISTLVHGIVLLSIPVIATLFLKNIVYPYAEYYVDVFQFGFNFAFIWSWIFPSIFLCIPLVFSFKLRQIEWYRKTWIWVIPFTILNFAVGKTFDVRLFLPVLVYFIPLTIVGIVDATRNCDEAI